MPDTVYGLPVTIDTSLDRGEVRLDFPLHMDLDTVIARLRAGLHVVCDHDVYEEATRHVSATAFAAAHAARTPSLPDDLCDDPA